MTRVERYSIPTTVHGHCLVEVPSTPGPHPLLVGFHGYGETVEVQAERMRAIPGASAWVLASVEALHLFYTKKHRDVVGSWMTKRHREQASADNVAYVAATLARLRRELPVDERLAYVGFSQGVAMAYRAAAWAGPPCRALVAIGGDMPPEVAAEATLRWPPVLVTRGERDEFFTREKMDRDLACLRARGAEARALVFDGGHEWSEAVFTAAGEVLGAAFARTAPRGGGA